MLVEEQNYWDSVWDTDTSDLSLERIRKEEYFAELESLLTQYKPQRILEAGCGRGQWIAGLQALGFRVDGADFSNVALSVARENCKSAHLFQCDLRSIPVESDYYDFILSLGVIEHFEEGLHDVLKEHARILRANGIMFAHVPFLNLNRRLNPLYRVYEGLRQNSIIRRLLELRPTIFFEYMLTKKEAVKLFEECGFMILKYSPIYVGGGFEYDIPSFLRGRWTGAAVKRLRKYINMHKDLFGPIFAHHQLIIAIKN